MVKKADTKSELDVLIAERKKEAIEKVAPRIVEVVSVLGTRTPYGFTYRHNVAEYSYNELTDIVTVTQGPNEVFAVNLSNKRCSVFKQGTWVIQLDELFTKNVEAQDSEQLKRRHEVKFRENFGIFDK